MLRCWRAESCCRDRRPAATRSEVALSYREFSNRQGRLTSSSALNSMPGVQQLFEFSLNHKMQSLWALFSYPVRRVSCASTLRRASSRSRSESEILVNRTPKPKLGIRYITTHCTEMYSPSGRVSLRLSVSPTSTGPSVSMKHPVALMSTVRARELMPDPSHDASITSGLRSCFLFSSVIIAPLWLLLGLVLRPSGA
jgi:hypothetical protein